MALSPGSNTKYRRLGTTIILLVVLAVAQPFLWQYVQARALGLQQTRSQEQQIENMQARNNEIKKVLESESDFLNQLDVVAPLITAKTQVVERIEQLGDQLGLVMDITVIQELPANGTIVKEAAIVPVSISVQTVGTPQQLLSLMDRIEHTQELSIVSSWSLVPAPPQPGPTGTASSVANSTYTLSMDVFFFLRRFR